MFKNFSIKKIDLKIEKISQLNEQFIPDTIARTEDIINLASNQYVDEKIDSIPQSEWEISDSSNKAYI